MDDSTALGKHPLLGRAQFTAPFARLFQHPAQERWLPSLHPEVEPAVAIETEVLGLPVLMMAKIAVGLGTVVP